MHEWTWHANDENRMYAVFKTKEHAKCRCVVMQWLMQMQCTNMMNEKRGNDMSIAMSWRDAYVVYDTNVFYRHENLENYFFLLATFGSTVPHVCT